jgi:hypothetical protein
MSKINIDIIIKELKEWAESEEGKEYFGSKNKEEDIKLNRFKRFGKWLKHNDFDKLMYRVILEHDDNYITNCYHNGFMPYPNNKMQFIIDYVFRNGESVKVPKLDCSFPNEVCDFNGYYFQMIFGQGTVVHIYNKEDLRLVLAI